MKKNIKLVLALVLSIMMVLGSMSALAADQTVTTPTDANKNTGSFSITMTGAEDGHTFKAYKIFEGSLSGTGAMGDISWATNVVLDGTTDIYADLVAAGLNIADNAHTAQGVANAMKGLDDDIDTLKKVADVFYARKGSANPAGSTSTFSNNEYVISSLTVGYYLVTDEYTSTAAEGAATLSRNILAVVGDVTAAVKNTKPTIEKKILDPNPVDANEAGVGETVVYQISSNVPNYEGYDNYFFVINDKLSGGLTFNADSVVVKVGNDIQTAGTDYVLYTSSTTPAVESGYTFQVAFKNIKSKTIGAAVTVTYNAVVNSSAVIGKTGNPNEVDLIYSHNPNNSHGGNPSDNPRPGEDIPTGKTPKDKTITYVAELELTKYFDEVSAQKLLAGAQFTLVSDNVNVPKGKTAEKYVAAEDGTFWKLKDDTFTATAPHGDITRSDGTVEIKSNEDAYESTTQKYKLTSETEYDSQTKTVIMQGTSGQDGKIKFTGLGAGTYTLKETVTPKGYTTAEDITFTISVEVPAKIETGNETATWSSSNANVTLNGGATTGVYVTNVIDLSGATLPSTGGIGTTIFYVAGSIMVLAAAILLITKRRMSGND